MRESIRRQFLFLRAYTLATSLLLVIVAAAAFRQAPAGSKDPAELTVRRSTSSMPTANPRIEFLHEDGKVVARVPEK